MRTQERSRLEDVKHKEDLKQKENLNKKEDAPALDDAGGDFIVRRGLYFQVGDYPDKQFSLNIVEADAAIAAFAPVPLNVEHIPTIFDGKLGIVRRLWREGRDILAEYAIPRWLNEVTEGEALKISSEWNRRSKRPQGGAFVLSPRIVNAVMLAAFQNVADVKPLIRRIETEKEPDLMSLLSGIKALFQRAGVPPEEIDAHLLDSHLSDAPPSASHKEDAAQDVGTEFATIGNLSPGTIAETPGEERTEERADERSVAIRFAAMEMELTHLRATTEAAQQQAEWALIQAEQAQFQEDTHTLDALVREFQMTPAESDAWREIARANPVAFAAILPALHTRPRLPHLTTVTVRASETADADRLESLTRQRMKEQGVDHTAAFKAVCTENRELALSVRVAAQDGK